MTTFIDTNVLFAVAIPSDGRHADAARLVRALGTTPQVTTDHVLVETWNLICTRRDRSAAMRFWSALRHGPVDVEHVTAPDLERAQAIAAGWPDQDFDIVDCTSFAVMERLGCYRAASFDDHFAIYRMGPDRARAFDIVRA